VNLATVASPVAVGAGRAIVYGFPYDSSANINVVIPTPVINTTGYRIVLRASWAAQTVRLTLISSADGVAALPAITQNAGVTWDINLLGVTCTVAGVLVVTDERNYITMGNMLATDRRGDHQTEWLNRSVAPTDWSVPSPLEVQFGIEYEVLGVATATGRVVITLPHTAPDTYRFFGLANVFGEPTGAPGTFVALSAALRESPDPGITDINVLWAGDGVTTYDTISVNWVVFMKRNRV